MDMSKFGMLVPAVLSHFAKKVQRAAAPARSFNQEKMNAKRRRQIATGQLTVSNGLVKDGDAR